MSLNNYDERLSKDFQKSDIKPDKQYSFTPTILGIFGDLTGKVVLDLGCGDGFFTRALANAGAKEVIGIDNSEEQIRLAKEKYNSPNISYQLGDIFRDLLPKSDLILVPFVLNYAESLDDLNFLIKNIYQSLNFGGKALFVVDLPKGKDLKKFGSVKTLLGGYNDGSKIKIDLYNGDEFICTLYSYYYLPQTIQKISTDCGFKSIKWHKPIVSLEGMEKLGKDFWCNFTEDSELGYLSVEK